MRRLGPKLSRCVKRAVRFSLLPVVGASGDVLMGGQAVIEGVMMRSPHSFAVAVRRPKGSIAVTRDFLMRPSEKHRSLRFPVLRGLGTLGQALVLGVKALRYSAERAVEDSEVAAERPEKEKGQTSSWLVAVNVAFSLGFFIFLYKFVPLYLATLLKEHYPAVENVVVFNLVDGTIRIALFFAFLWFLAQWKDIQRVFEYHGAEHKAVWAFERGGPIDVATARTCSRFHPRCGTSFLLVVMAIAMVFFMLLPFHSFAGRFVGRILLLPLIAGVSYEFIRFAGKSRGKLWRWASQPGLWLQRLTTREPDDSQLEVAIRALETTMELEKSRGGELVVA